MNPIKHVAIIMDGNGRWGIQNKGSRNLGHRAGLDTIELIIEETIKQKISYLTLYTFSTENWKRPQKEISYLFNLLEKFLLTKIEKLKKNKIRLKVIGNQKKLSTSLKKLLAESEKKTSVNSNVFASPNLKVQINCDALHSYFVSTLKNSKIIVILMISLIPKRNSLT